MYGLSPNVADRQHVSVVGELSRLVEVNSLLDVSELEQEMACQATGDTLQVGCAVRMNTVWCGAL